MLEAGAVAVPDQGRGLDRIVDVDRRGGEADAREPDDAEHRDRPRLDGRFPGCARSASRTSASCRSTSISTARATATTSTSRPDELYARLAGAAAPPTTSQPTPGDFLRVYEELARSYERILSLQLSSTLSGTFASAVAAGEQVGDAVRVIDTRTVSAAIAMLAIAIQRRLERGTSDEEIEALVERYLTHARPALHCRHARVPRPRRPDRPRRPLRRDAPSTSSRSSASSTERWCRSSACAAARRRSRSSRSLLVADDRQIPRRFGSGSRTRRRPSGSRALERLVREARPKATDRGRLLARCRRRHPRRAGHARPVLVRRRATE